MKKHSDSPLAAFHPAPFNTPTRARLRYVGFEGIDGGRRLTFSVKSLGHDSFDSTIEISDASLKGAPGISIQDAAPLAYQKLVQLLAIEDALESKELCLTEADIAHHIARHVSSQKRAYSMSDRRRRSDVRSEDFTQLTCTKRSIGGPNHTRKDGNLFVRLCASTGPAISADTLHPCTAVTEIRISSAFWPSFCN
jgi:hypothetical protein